ncbi:hypothetical protein [Phytoactinopolyspora halotolerans]|uniref:Uncharacterized protein n=1 Tax=Phytoactinopolyspora halotolerans TaxID=1981512 RepID=A0A6L9SC95_9ACTN|nr:hypothetical protein [Phytoactinopolyspora halotolerans]NEE02856.1 hypothetical protein [Phytoactinopolyspora halotolerans]
MSIEVRLLPDRRHTSRRTGGSTPSEGEHEPERDDQRWACTSAREHVVARFLAAVIDTRLRVGISVRIGTRISIRVSIRANRPSVPAHHSTGRTPVIGFTTR